MIFGHAHLQRNTCIERDDAGESKHTDKHIITDFDRIVMRLAPTDLAGRLNHTTS